MSATQDFNQQLRRQLTFLQVSANAYDGGEREEAIRIATTLRVIFHDTPQSTSLLHHLGQLSILVRSQAYDRDKQNALLGGRIIGEFSWSLAVLSGADGGRLLAHTDPATPHRLVKADVWWIEIFGVVDSKEYRRRDVVLWVHPAK